MLKVQVPEIKFPNFLDFKATSRKIGGGGKRRRPGKKGDLLVGEENPGGKGIKIRGGRDRKNPGIKGI